MVILSIVYYKKKRNENEYIMNKKIKQIVCLIRLTLTVWWKYVIAWVRIMKESDVITVWGLEQFTWTDDTSILMMTTVLYIWALWPTVFQCSLWSTTSYNSHWNWSWSLSKVSIFCCCYSRPTVQLSTHHCSISNIPPSMTHCSPLTIIINLHSTSTGIITIHQPHTHTVYTWERDN